MSSFIFLHLSITKAVKYLILLSDFQTLFLLKIKVCNVIDFVAGCLGSWHFNKDLFVNPMGKINEKNSGPSAAEKVGSTITFFRFRKRDCTDLI